MLLSDTMNTLFMMRGSSFSLKRMRSTLKFEPPKSSARISLLSLPVGKLVTYVGNILNSASLFVDLLKPFSISDSSMSIICRRISSESLSSSKRFSILFNFLLEIILKENPTKQNESYHHAHTSSISSRLFLVLDS